MIGHGVSSRSSHSWAAGRITSAAKPCTQSRMSFWSWLSSSEKVTSWPAAPEIASTAASAASVAAGVATADGADADIERDLLRLAARNGVAGPADPLGTGLGLPAQNARQTGRYCGGVYEVNAAMRHFATHVSYSRPTNLPIPILFILLVSSSITTSMLSITPMKKVT